VARSFSATCLQLRGWSDCPHNALAAFVGLLVIALSSRSLLAYFHVI